MPNSDWLNMESLDMTETQVQVLANSLYQMGFGDYLWKKAGGKYDSKL